MGVPEWLEKLNSDVCVDVPHPAEGRRLLDQDGSAAFQPAFPSLDLRVFLHSEHPDGAWYWVNIPTIHTALELHLIGMQSNTPVSISNEAVQLSTFRPNDPSVYELRFLRHRELHAQSGDSTDSCAIVRGVGVYTNALRSNIVNLGQIQVGQYTDLCAFDLVIWRPKPNGFIGGRGDNCEVGIAAGSSAMGGSGGRILTADICVASLAGTPPVVPAPPPAEPPSHRRFPTEPRSGYFAAVSLVPVAIASVILLAMVGKRAGGRKQKEAEPSTGYASIGNSQSDRFSLRLDPLLTSRKP